MATVGVSKADVLSVSINTASSNSISPYEALDCQTNSLCQYRKKCIENSMENIDTDVREDLHTRKDDTDENGGSRVHFIIDD